MILLVRFRDGTEEAFEVSEHTKLKGLQKDGYWTFNVLGGGEVALDEQDVTRVELGNVQFADERGRIDADGAEAS